MRVWIAGRFCDDGSPWEVLGVYSTEAAAADRCTRWEDFIAPLTMDESTPEDPEHWAGMYYPIAEGRRNVA